MHFVPPPQSHLTKSSSIESADNILLAKHLWRNDITGLRALAVLPVLIYHAFPNALPGGFFGVDVFFVISGYLISGIIFRALLADNFSYLTFYEKRIKRIIPNLALVFLLVCALGYCFLLPAEYANLGKHVYSSAAFAQNFRLLGEMGYFTEDALRKPLLHLWSLAIEEQFYIFFPILCAVLWRCFRSVTLIGIVCLLLGFGSLEASLLLHEKARVFYFPLTRIWELAAGVGLAYVESFGLFKPHRLAVELRHVLSVLGLLLIIVPMALKYGVRHHPGAITLAPVLGSVLIIAANVDACVNKTLLACRPMRFVGLISYSLYLWHWPLLAFLFICVPDAGAGVRAAALAVAFIVSTAVYLFVENPMRRTAGHKVTWGLLGVLILSFSIGQYLSVKKGLPERPFAKSMEAVNAVRNPHEWLGYDQAKRFEFQGLKLPVSDPTSEVPEIVFAGDSHAAQYFYAAQALARQYARPLLFIASWRQSVFDPKLGNPHSKAFRALIENPRVKTLVLAQKWGSRLRSNPKVFNQMILEMKAALDRRPDMRVYVLFDQPWVEEKGRQGITDPLRHLNRLTAGNAQKFIIDIPEDNTWKKGNEAVQRLLGNRAQYVDVTPYICPNGQCDLLKWYRDDDHLQPLSLMKYGEWLRQIFESNAQNTPKAK